MQFSKLALLATALATGASAAPAAAEPAVTLLPAPAPLPDSVAAPTPAAAVAARDLDKRATEGIHLVNCNNDYSVVVYCASDSNCNFTPAVNNRVQYSGIVHWEGQTISSSFPSGVTFTFQIDSDAQSKPFYSAVGTGSNGFHTNWIIYKDDYHKMWTDSAGRSCNSIYYSHY